MEGPPLCGLGSRPVARTRTTRALPVHAARQRRHRDLLEGGALLDVLLPFEAAESGNTR